MAFTAAQLAELEAAYARGATSVRHGDKTVTYDSLDSLWKAIQRMRTELTSPRGPDYIRMTYKGVKD